MFLVQGDISRNHCRLPAFRLGVEVLSSSTLASIQELVTAHICSYLHKSSISGLTPAAGFVDGDLDV